MEDPLLDSHIHSHEVGPSRYHDALRTSDICQKAAALVDLADDDVGVPQEVLHKHDYEEALSWYLLDMRLNLFWSLNLAAIIVLNFVEMPLWCKGSSSNPCGSRQDYYLGELPYLSRLGSFYYEVVTWAIIVIHTFFPISYLGNKIFWQSRTNLMKVIIMALLGIDIFVYALYAFPSAPIENLPFRFAPYLRVFVVIVDVRKLRECVKTLAAISRVMDMVVLFLLFLLFSSCLAFVLFEDTSQGKTYFSTYGYTLYYMFVLFTTSNNPDVWLPAYRDHRYSCLFFIIYILFGVYFITNLILAVVYDSFKDQLKIQIKDREEKRRSILLVAFETLDVHNRAYLDKQQCVSLFKAMDKYRTLPKIEEKDFDAMFVALDDSQDFKITVDEFQDLCELITLKFPKAPEPSWFARFRWYNSTVSIKLRAFVRSKVFEYLVLGMLLLNLVAVIIETTLDLQNSTSQEAWQDVEFVFGWLYVVEVLLKIYAYGFLNYWRDGLNKFDFLITCIIVVGETLTFALPNTVPIFSNEEWIRYLIIARLLRLIRLLMHVKRYRVIISTFLKLIPYLTPHFGMIFCLMCLYSTLGIQLFGGLVNDYNETVESTSLYDNDYLVHNFNDFPTAMVTLFELLVMGNWQAWLESFVTLTGTWWTSLYFITFYGLAVLFLLNLVIAFVLEAFFAEMQRNADDSSQLDEMDDPVNRARCAKSENVESLIRIMLAEAS